MTPVPLDARRAAEAAARRSYGKLVAFLAARTRDVAGAEDALSEAFATALTGSADWTAIEQLYDALCVMTGSPVAALNRAVAVAQTREAAAGLQALDAIAGDARLADYQPYWAVRADLLARVGDSDSAAAAYQQAIGLERDPAVRAFLQQRAARLAS